MEDPSIAVGTPKEYAHWESRIRRFLVSRGARPDDIERIDGRYNFRQNRITLYRLADPDNELSAAETLAHEMLHALLEQMGESWAARAIDLVAKPVGNPDRRGGL